MAEMIEAKGNAFFLKCKGVAVIVAAVSGLVLGVLNWFKESKDPKAKAGYQELALQVESLSRESQALVQKTNSLSKELDVIVEILKMVTSRLEHLPSSVLRKLDKAVPSKPLPAPPRKPPVRWDQLQVSRGP